MSVIREYKSYLMLGMKKEDEPKDVSMMFLQLNGNEKELEKLATLVSHADYSTLHYESCSPIEIVVYYLDYDLVFSEIEMKKLCSTHIPTLDRRSDVFMHLNGKIKFDFTYDDIEKMSGTEAAIYLDKILYTDGSIYNYWKDDLC